MLLADSQRAVPCLTLATVLAAMVAGPAPAQNNPALNAPAVKYKLTERSTYQTGCFDPCDCPLSQQVPLQGTFTLTRIAIGDVMNAYKVSDIAWTVRLSNNEEIKITGEGTYRTSEQLNVGHQLELDLSIGQNATQHFESDFIPGGGEFPRITIAVDMNRQVCFDTVLSIDAVPANEPPPSHLPRHAVFSVHPRESSIELTLFTGSMRSPLGGTISLFLGDPNVPVIALAGMVGVSVDGARLVAPDFEPELPGTTEPLFMIQDPHVRSIGAWNTLTGDISFELHLIAPNGNLPVPQPVTLHGHLNNAGLSVAGDNGNIPDGTMKLKINAWEIKPPGLPKDLWFSTEGGFSAGNLPTTGSFFTPVSDGDLLSRRGHIVRTNHELARHLGIMPVVPDLGLDAAVLAPRGQVWFSFEEDTPHIWSETLARWLKHGDLLSDRGFVVATNEELLDKFGRQPVLEDAGLDAVTRAANGAILFSTETDFQAMTLAGRIVRHGDLISNRGHVVRTNRELLANFNIIEITQGPLPPDYGLDAVITRPYGEFWFSVETGFQDRNLGWVSDGDLLSTKGAVVARNLDLVEALGPLEDVANFGLDALDSVMPRIIADFNNDGSVDQADFGLFQQAISGPNALSASPEYGDLDGDGDVDQNDFGILQNCMSGAGIPGDPDCAED